MHSRQKLAEIVSPEQVLVELRQRFGSIWQPQVLTGCNMNRGSYRNVAREPAKHAFRERFRIDANIYILVELGFEVSLFTVADNNYKMAGISCIFH